MRSCGISSRFRLLSPCTWQVTHALLTRPPLSHEKFSPQQADSLTHHGPVRLACVKHAASVHPEPGSNSRNKINFVNLEFPLRGTSAIESLWPLDQNKPGLFCILFTVRSVRILSILRSLKSFSYRLHRCLLLLTASRSSSWNLFQGCITVYLSRF